MYLFRTTDGTIGLMTSQGYAWIGQPSHVDLFTRMFKAHPSFDTFNIAERDIIISYIKAASTADDAETAKILDALGKIKLPPATIPPIDTKPIVDAVKAAIASQGVEVDLEPVLSAIQSGVASINENINDQPTEFTISPKE